MRSSGLFIKTTVAGSQIPAPLLILPVSGDGRYSLGSGCEGEIHGGIWKGCETLFYFLGYLTI